MKNKLYTKVSVVAAVMMLPLLMAAGPADEVITRSGKTEIVNTTSIASKVKGFRGATPVKIYIERGKVVRIEALKNHETPRFFNIASKVLDKFSGKSVSKASKMDVDAVSGATFSSKALIENVQTGLKYYNKNK